MSICLILSGCTYSINMIHSNRAKDIIDENQRADADIKPNLNLPSSI
jgi:hypothetical protein